MTGANIKAVLEQQFYTVTDGTVSSRFLQPSTGFTYTWTNTAAAGSRVSDMKLNGVPIDPAASYRVTANNFLTTGGDGFTEFLNAHQRPPGPDRPGLVRRLPRHAQPDRRAGRLPADQPGPLATGPLDRGGASPTRVAPRRTS